MQNLDSAERALLVAVSTDFYFCLYCPALVLYACPVVRRNCRVLLGIRSQHSKGVKQNFAGICSDQ